MTDELPIPQPDPSEEPDGPRKHWHDCWQFVGHQGCAIARVMKLEKELAEANDRIHGLEEDAMGDDL